MCNRNSNCAICRCGVVSVDDQGKIATPTPRGGGIEGPLKTGLSCRGAHRTLSDARVGQVIRHHVPYRRYRSRSARADATVGKLIARALGSCETRPLPNGVAEPMFQIVSAPEIGYAHHKNN